MKVRQGTQTFTNTKEEIAQKQCSRCGVRKPYSSFYRNKSKRDGHESYCKECAKHRNLLKRIKNKKIDPFSGGFTVVFNGLPEEKAFISKLETIIEEVIE